MSLARRFVLRASDSLRYSRSAREAGGWWLYVRGRMARNPQARAARLVRAFGLAESPALQAAARAGVQSHPGFATDRPWIDLVWGLPRYRARLEREPGLTRSIVLKAPAANGEKGVLLLTFEYNWARLLLGVPGPRFRWLDDNYSLLLSTSWSPTDYAVLGLALARTSGPLYVQSCNYDEIPKIEAFHPRLRCLPTLPCDWINADLFAPRPFDERTTDILMVANWSEFKRHWELFRALTQMRQDLKVVLIGAPIDGGTRQSVAAMARDLGVKQDLVLVEKIPIEEVAAHQCRAKVAVIMSRREGCCVAAVESLFAGCALGMRADAHVGPLAYINEMTGRRLRPGHIREDLEALLRAASRCRPRQWAVEHVAHHVSWRRVNDFLRTEASRLDRPWTRDLSLPQWRPHPTFAVADEQTALRPAYADLHDRFPEVFPENLWAESWR